MERKVRGKVEEVTSIGKTVNLFVKETDTKEVVVKFMGFELPFVLRTPPMSVKTKALGKAVNMSVEIKNGKKTPQADFDSDAYYTRMLEYMIIDSPETNDSPGGPLTAKQLSQMHIDIREQLEEHVPPPFDGEKITEAFAEATKNS